MSDSIIKSINGEEEAESISKSASQSPTPWRLAGWSSWLTKAKVRLLVTSITVEPVAFLSAIAMVMQAVVVQQLVSEQSCRITYNRTDEYCRNVTDLDFKRQLKDVMAHFNLYARILTIGPYVFYSLLFGSFCDRHGPKLMILMPLLGDLASSSTLAVVSYLWALPPQMTLIASAFNGLSGSHMAYYMGMNTYLVLNSSSRSRTARLAMLEVAYMAGLPLGYLLGGQLFGSGHFTRVFLVSLCVTVLSISYISFKLRHEPFLRTSARRALSNVFSVSDFKDSLTVLCKKRPGSNRTHVILGLVCAKLLIFPLSGDYTVIFPFTQLKFNYTVKDFSNYDAFTIGIRCIATLTILPFLSYVLKVNDIVLGMISIYLLSASYLIIGLSTSTVGLYLASLLQIGFAGGYVVCRSMMSKCVNQNEQGKLNAIYGLISAGIPIVSSLVYTEIFHATLATFPGACFVLSAVLTLLPASVFAWIHYNVKKNKLPSIVADEVELLDEPELEESRENTLPILI